MKRNSNSNVELLRIHYVSYQFPREKKTYLDPIRIGKTRTFFLFTYSDLLFFFLPIRILFFFLPIRILFFLFFSFYLFGSVFFFLPIRIRFFFLFLFTFLDQLFHVFTFSDRQDDRKSNNIPFYRISMAN